MKNFGTHDHDIYKKRGRMNMQIGILLGAFVILVVVATIAKLSSSQTTTEAVAEQPQ